ncbi:nitrogenase component 1 [Clostridium sp. DJ247]|uniref:nitrogenase component 1 n=1 Tax=Clostridium sp. DJ247 TaxID=2726188 RepID=UPI0016266973|nr:nitrogenase component 1 [Clostridium sp. DJ247]MBC2580712.1 nitrogenase [Clostridium sp. DJ247]
MNYINNEKAPVREDRLKAINAFGGSCSFLQDCAKKGCLNGYERSFGQTQGCQFTLSLAIINTLRNSVIIMHGPIGCGASSIGTLGTSKTFKQLRDPNANGLIWLNTNLDEHDVINGGENKLRETVLYADKEFRPDAIIVANACVPALIGDDVESVLLQLQNEVSATLVPVHCEGFRTKIMATAYDSVYHGILKKLVKDPEREERVYEDELEQLKEKYRLSRTVNVLNVSSMSRPDEVELERLLNALGLKVRFLPCYAEPETFKHVSEAALNVSICATHDDYFIKHIEEIYGIPFVLKTIPIGRKNTDIWIKDIAAYFGLEKEAEKLIEKENRELNEALEPYRQTLKGKTAYLAGGEIRILSTAELLIDLGIKVLGMKGFHYDEFADPLLEVLPDKERTTFNAATGQPFELANLIERDKPDVIIGHSGGNSMVAKQGIPVLPLFGPTYNYLGYSGSFEIARRLNRLFKNTMFNKNIAENTKLPYKKEWFEKEPFHYIKQS